MNRLKKILGGVVKVARWIVRADSEVRAERCRACDSSRAAGCWGFGGPDAALWCEWLNKDGGPK